MWLAVGMASEVPELERSVFVIPPEAFKTKRAHVVILNDVAWSIIKSQRGKHPIWVFPFRGRRMERMNNNGWQQARHEVRLLLVRVHDLRHSFACRLRAAGVSAEVFHCISQRVPKKSLCTRIANGD
jgi:integrase